MKRLITTLLTISMALTLVPSGASAAETPPATGAQVTIVEGTMQSITLASGDKAGTDLAAFTLYNILCPKAAGTSSAGYVGISLTQDAQKAVTGGTLLPYSSMDTVNNTVYLASKKNTMHAIAYVETGLSDIANHWAKDDITFVAARGLLNGTSPASFSPDSTLTRGMLVTALGRLEGIVPAKYQDSPFTDVAKDAYYAPYVAWAAAQGIINGTTATTFAPDDAITREALAAIMVNYAKSMAYTLPQVRASVTFSDEAQIASWARDAVKTMQRAAILGGKEAGSFDPAGTATRAEAAAILHRYVESFMAQQIAQPEE